MSRRRKPRGKAAGSGRRPKERGILLVGLLVSMTVMIILLTASAQSWATIMQRERELEVIFRGNQYIIALQQYAKEHGGAYPMELEELLKKGPTGHRYIRQLFRDPFDKKGEWNLLYLSPNGKGAINPNARFPLGGVLGAGGVGGAGAGVMGGALTVARNRTTGLGDRGRGRDDDKSGFDRGTSGFGAATMVGPIVGVVSKSKEEGFRMYYGRHHYDEWEFHVFLKKVKDPQRRRGGGGVANPTGKFGTGTFGVGKTGDANIDNKPRNPTLRGGRRGN